MRDMFTRKKFLSVAGAMISIISIITLPDDVGTWSGRITAIWGMAKDNPISAVALVVGLTLLALANWDRIRQLFGAKRWRSDVELGNEIHGWLRHAKYQLRDLTAQEIKPGMELGFGFVGIEPISDRPVTILKLVGEPAIVLQTRVIPSDVQNHRQIIANMTVRQRDDILEDIDLELARLGVGFSTQDLLGQGIVISHGIIPSDSMSQYQFMTGIGLVSRAILIVQLVVTRHVRRANPATPLAQTSPAVPQVPATQDARETS